MLQSESDGAFPVTIANGASLSGAAALNNQRLVAIIMPAAWTAAGLTFQASDDGTNWFNLHDGAGTEVSLTVAASRYVRLAPLDWSRIRYLKVRSGTSGAPVNQGADRIVTLLTRPAA